MMSRVASRVVSWCDAGGRPAPPCAGMAACSVRRCCGTSDVVEGGSVGLAPLAVASAAPCGVARSRAAMSAASAGVVGRPAPPFAGKSSRGSGRGGGAADAARAVVSSLVLSGLADAVSGWLSVGRESAILAGAGVVRGAAVAVTAVVVLGSTCVNEVAAACATGCAWAGAVGKVGGMGDASVDIDAPTSATVSGADADGAAAPVGVGSPGVSCGVVLAAVAPACAVRAALCVGALAACSGSSSWGGTADAARDMLRVVAPETAGTRVAAAMVGGGTGVGGCDAAALGVVVVVPL